MHITENLIRGIIAFVLGFIIVGCYHHYKRKKQIKIMKSRKL